MTDPRMMRAFDDWISRAENGRMPAYWAMLAFAAGWTAALAVGGSHD